MSAQLSSSDPSPSITELGSLLGQLFSPSKAVLQKLKQQSYVNIQLYCLIGYYKYTVTKRIFELFLGTFCCCWAEVKTGMETAGLKMGTTGLVASSRAFRGGVLVSFPTGFYGDSNH